MRPPPPLLLCIISRQLYGWLSHFDAHVTLGLQLGCLHCDVLHLSAAGSVVESAGSAPQNSCGANLSCAPTLLLEIRTTEWGDRQRLILPPSSSELIGYSP